MWGTAGDCPARQRSPSADHTFQSLASTPGTWYHRIDVINTYADQFQRWIEPYVPLAATSVRISLGLTFIYLGVTQKLLQPGLALAVVEQYHLTSVLPVAPELWVLGAGLTEAALGALLVVGVFTRASASVSLVMFTLTMFALPDDPVLAHVSLFGLASVLLITGAGPYSVDRLVTTRRWGSSVE
ncbi:MAG: DoxX family protein [Natrialbaceae archaeon]|nr:DoxX family protein [Natrialbaceae archaeon]